MRHLKTGDTRIVYQKPKKYPSKNILLIDASHSMMGEKQLGFLKGVILKSLQRQRRAFFSVVVMQASTANVVLPFTDDIRAVSDTVKNIQSSGKTNLLAGFERVAALSQVTRLKEPAQLFVFTDGRANVGGKHPFFDAISCFRQHLAQPHLKTTIVNTEMGLVRIGCAKVLAQKMGVNCLFLRDLVI